MRTIFSKCGYNRNTKLAVLYGPTRYGGAGFRNLVHEQGIHQLTAFVRHWRSPGDLTGQLSRIAVAWIQWSIGTSRSFLHDTTSPLPHMESDWFASLRQFIGSTDISLELDNPSIPKLPRQKDAFIIDLVLSSNQFTASEVCKINYCRLYLGAVFVSDLSLAHGKTLDLAKLRGRKPLFSTKTRWHAVHQNKPDRSSWRLWERANLLWSTKGGVLLKTLGIWTIHPRRMRRLWFASVDINTGTLYIRQQSGHTNGSSNRTTREHNIDEDKYTIAIDPHPNETAHQMRECTFTRDQLPTFVLPVHVRPTRQGWEIHDHEEALSSGGGPSLWLCDRTAPMRLSLLTLTRTRRHILFPLELLCGSAICARVVNSWNLYLRSGIACLMAF